MMIQQEYIAEKQSIIATGNMDLKIEIINTLEQFADLKFRWNEIIESNSNYTIFSTWEWSYHWWLNFYKDRELMILTFKNSENEIVGIAPLIRVTAPFFKSSTIKIIMVLASENSGADYLDIIVLPEYRNRVIKNMVRYLDDHKEMWDVVHLTDLYEDASILNYFRQVENHNGFKIRIKPAYICPYIDLTGGYNEWLNSRSKNFKKSHKSSIRQLNEKYNFDFKSSVDWHDLENVTDTLIRLHQKRWNRLGHPGKYKDPRYISFTKQIIKDYWMKYYMKFGRLQVDQKIVAIEYGFIFNDCYYAFLTGFDPDFGEYSVGRLLLDFMVKDCINDNLKQLDMLRGSESYKFRYTKKFKKTYDLIFSHKNIKGLLYIHMKNARLFVSQTRKKIIPDNKYMKLKKYILKRRRND